MGTKEESWWNDRTLIALILIQFVLTALILFVLEDRGIRIALSFADSALALLIFRRLRSRGLPAATPTPTPQQYEDADLSFRHFVRLVQNWFFRSRLRFTLYMWVATTCAFLVIVRLRGADPGLAFFAGASMGIAVWWVHPGPPDEPPQ